MPGVCYRNANWQLSTLGAHDVPTRGEGALSLEACKASALFQSV